MGKFMRGDTMMYKRHNAWADVGMSTKAEIECRVPTKEATVFQQRARNALIDAAERSIHEFPADGTFRTLMARVKWIGKQLRGKVHAKRVYVPQSAIAEHPAIIRARERGQTAVRREKGVAAPLAPLASREELL